MTSRIETRTWCRRVGAFSFAVLLLPLFAAAEEDETTRRERMYQRFFQFPAMVKGGSIVPNWMPDGDSFWYSEGAPANTVIYRVTPEEPSPSPFFDTERVREGLTPLLGHAPPYQGLPFAVFTFAAGGNAIEFEVEERPFRLDLASYRVTPLPYVSEEERKRAEAQFIRKGFTSGAPDAYEVASPDGSWFLTDEEGDLWLRSALDDQRVRLTDDGVKDFGWSAQGATWSPDGLRLMVSRDDQRRLERLPVVRWLQKTEQVDWFQYTKSGQPLSRTEFYVIDVTSKRRVLIEESGLEDHYHLPLGWRPDGKEVVFLRIDRIFRKLDLVAADARTGKARIVLTETSPTFIGALHFLTMWQQLVTAVGDGSRFVWMSERDGFRHLYLYDDLGNLIRQLTSGAFPVIRVEAVDEGGGWVYFTANAEEDPYDQHVYRVDLEGQHFERLTEGEGRHAVRFSPSRRYFVDIHSSNARPPRTEYRRADGLLLETVAEADISALEELGWQPPERFVVKAADGETDLHGVLFRPVDFDPTRKYPILDHIYNGPFTTWVPRTFVGGTGIVPQAMAQLGFLVMIVDGRGTIERGKEFQDVVFRAFGQNEIPDHAAALKQIAAERPYIDLERVGIFGGSWGGYMTVRAMVTHPDVYHAGVATAPVYDLYDHAAAAIEGYMGLPQENPEAYRAASSLLLADQLKGKLMLIHGTSDVNATFSSTMKMTDALIRSGIQHDLVVIPEADHSIAGPGGLYLVRARRLFFQRHLRPDLIVPVEDEEPPEES